jgi:hypothetical protein
MPGKIAIRLGGVSLFEISRRKWLRSFQLSYAETFNFLAETNTW